jgi:hypothetical protein
MISSRASAVCLNASTVHRDADDVMTAVSVQRRKEGIQMTSAAIHPLVRRRVTSFVRVQSRDLPIRYTFSCRI